MSSFRRLVQILSAGLFVLLISNCKSAGDEDVTGEVLMRFTLPREGTTIELDSEALLGAGFTSLRIEVPEGAVETPIEIKLVKSRSLIDGNISGKKVPAGPALRLEPANLKLLKPLQISLPYDKRAIWLDDELGAVVSSEYTDLENPLRHVVVSNPRVPYRVAAAQLGNFQALVGHPMGISNSELVNKLDVLFVIDNSPSMANKQMALTKKFEEFITQIATCKAMEKIHIGVISTDVGLSSDGMGTPWPSGMQAGCTPQGDDGKLLGKKCLPSSSSIPYISIDIDKMTGKFTTNLAGNDVTDIQSAFKCMASLGEAGCSVESPFEALKRALRRKEAGFFQSTAATDYSALLLIVILTDEDDCSINRHDWSDPGNIADASDPKNPTWNNFNFDFRCSALSMKCKTDWLSTKGMKSDCGAYVATNPAERYLQSHMELQTLLNTEYRRSVVAGLWDMMPVDLSTKMDPPYPKMTASPSPVEIEYDSRPGASMTTPYLRHKRRLCGSGLPGSPNAASTAQYRLSAFADEMTAPPLATMQGDICSEAEYELILKLLQAALPNKKQCG